MPAANAEAEHVIRQQQQVDDLPAAVNSQRKSPCDTRYNSAPAGRASRTREAAEACNKTAALSPREREVLDGLVAGKPNKAIAYDLGISVRTVEVHRARMLERLGTRSTAEAIRLAVVAALAPHSAFAHQLD